MNNLEDRLNTLESIARDSAISYSATTTGFQSRKTQSYYSIAPTYPLLLNPILKLKNIFVTDVIMVVNDIERFPPEETMNIITKGRTLEQSESSRTENTLQVNVTQVYTDNLDHIGTILMETGDYEDLLVTHPTLAAVFKDNIYKGTTIYPTAEARDLTELKLYKHKVLNELVLVTNYTLEKRFQNKYGLLTASRRPYDCNYLILLGLAPAFIPALKDRLDEKEIEIFKLHTTPVKLYHEQSSAELYTELINTTAYDSLIKNFKVEKLREQLKRQEKHVFEDAIQRATRAVENLESQLRNAEIALLATQKDLVYYQAGESKFEDAIDYIFKHSYLTNFECDGGGISMLFRVPLSQWDPEMATTILKGIKSSPQRYQMDRAYAEDIKNFIQHILIDQVAKYWLLAEFDISLNDFSVNIHKIYYTSRDDFNDRPFKARKAGMNPHMEFHSCQGSYRVQIAKAQDKKDLPGLIESLLAPYKNWNLSDGVVQRSMFERGLPNLIRTEVPCIEYKGEMISIRELHNRIEAEKAPAPTAPTPKKRTRKPTEAGLNAVQQPVTEEERNDN